MRHNSVYKNMGSSSSSLNDISSQLSSLLGTYRGWGNIQVVNIMLMIIVFACLVFFYSIALTRRINSNNSLRFSIPKLVNPFSSIGMSLHLQQFLQKERTRQQLIRAQIEPQGILLFL